MTERRKRTAGDYGPRTSTLLANQAFKFERLLDVKRDELFELRAELWRAKRQVKQLLLQLEGRTDEQEEDPI